MLKRTKQVIKDFKALPGLMKEAKEKFLETPYDGHDRRKIIPLTKIG